MSNTDRCHHLHPTAHCSQKQKQWQATVAYQGVKMKWCSALPRMSFKALDRSLHITNGVRYAERYVMSRLTAINGQRVDLSCVKSLTLLHGTRRTPKTKLLWDLYLIVVIVSRASQKRELDTLLGIRRPKQRLCDAAAAPTPCPVMLAHHLASFNATILNDTNPE